MFYVWTEFPFTGSVFGAVNFDADVNALKFLNNNEYYHDWNKMKAELLYLKEKAEEE